MSGKLLKNSGEEIESVAISPVDSLSNRRTAGREEHTVPTKIAIADQGENRRTKKKKRQDRRTNR